MERIKGKKKRNKGKEGRGRKKKKIKKVKGKILGHAMDRRLRRKRYGL